MRLGDVPGQSGDHPACVRTPVRGEQPGEGGHDVGPAVVLHARRQRLDLVGAADDPELVAEPLHQRPGDRDRPLQAVDRRLVADLVPHGRQQPVLGRHGPLAGVEQQEAAGAVGVLGAADVVAGLSEDGRLLVAQRGGDGDAGELAHGGAVHLGGGPDLRQDGLGDVHGGADRGVPLEGPQIHQHGAAGVGDVRDVPSAVGAAGEVPDQPGVHGAERDLAALGPVPQPRHVVQQPGRLGAGEIAGQGQPGLLAETVLPVRAAQFVAERGRPGVLPDDRVVHGFAGGAVPEQRRLALVGDAQGAELVGAQSGLGERARHHGLHLGPDLGGVVLHPAGPGEDLAVLALVDGDDRAVTVEDDATARCRALVDRGDVRAGGVRHGLPLGRSVREVRREVRVRGRAAVRLPSGSVHRCSWGVKAADENGGTPERMVRKADETYTVHSGAVTGDPAPRAGGSAGARADRPSAHRPVACRYTGRLPAGTQAGRLSVRGPFACRYAARSPVRDPGISDTGRKPSARGEPCAARRRPRQHEGWPGPTGVVPAIPPSFRRRCPKIW